MVLRTLREPVIYLFNKKKSSFQKHTVKRRWAVPAKSYFCIWWALLRICIVGKENWQSLTQLHVIISHQYLSFVQFEPLEYPSEFLKFCHSCKDTILALRCQDEMGRNMMSFASDIWKEG